MLAQDYSTALAPLVSVRPSQFFRAADHFQTERPLLPKLPAKPARITIPDDSAVSVGVESAEDPSWQAAGLYVKRLGWVTANRDPEFLSLWLQDSFTALGVPCTATVDEVGNNDVFSINVRGACANMALSPRACSPRRTARRGPRWRCAAQETDSSAACSFTR